MSNPETAIQNTANEFFLSSSDFNGITVDSLISRCGVDLQTATKSLSQLIEKGLVSAVFGSHQGNPHIKRLDDLPISAQLEKLSADRIDTCCIYPTELVLRDRPDLEKFYTRHFSRRLALAEPQLRPVFFELGVLDHYFRDPRYHFEFHDFGGSINIRGSYYESSETKDRDKISVNTFGIAYNQKRQRVVVVYLRYLSDLSPEHQQIWAAHVITEPCVMNSDYARATLYGDWPEFYSAYSALIVEQEEINKLAVIIKKPLLFRDTFVDNRPSGFHPMLRPTKQNLSDFAHLLDKMLSENLSRDFFKGDVSLDEEVSRDDNKVEIRQKSTLTLLRDWLRKRYRTSDGEDVADEIVDPFRKIRRLRQKPAHTIEGDEHDISYPKLQDELVGNTVRSLQKLRYVLSSHPRARHDYTPPDWLDGDKIVFY